MIRRLHSKRSLQGFIIWSIKCI